MATLDRTFDRIEAVGVLHHLADPKTGWRVLLSLLRPNGTMRIGLYSETARRVIVEVRAFIAERGYRAAAEDIRAIRQTVIRNQRWESVTKTGDFYSMSGCRDLLFNVMEHRFTIPEIAAFLEEQDLTFLGFEPNPAIIEEISAAISRRPGAHQSATSGMTSRRPIRTRFWECTCSRSRRMNRPLDEQGRCIMDTPVSRRLWSAIVSD